MRFANNLRKPTMTNELYELLRDKLDMLPNGFPRVPSGKEIKILKKIFSPDEARLACHLTGTMEPITLLAERAESTVKEARRHFLQMVKKGLVWFEKKEGAAHFRLAPFVVGIYEAQVDLMDHELAHLVEDYFAEGGAAGIMKPDPSITRVVPSQRVMKSEFILPYDDVKKVLNDAKAFKVLNCTCRVQQDNMPEARKCAFPLKVCLTFSQDPRHFQQDGITREDAFRILDQAEVEGLVHTVSNVATGMGFLCNCCGCCCGMLRAINEYGIENSVAHANYYLEIDTALCVSCKKCEKRCQVNAINVEAGKAVVDKDKCLGCGVCVSTCPVNALSLVRKPENEIIDPPKNYHEWEHERLRNKQLL